MPNGYADAMCFFTNILKAPFSLSRKLRHLSVVYVDDTYLQDESFLECMHNLDSTVALLQALGFTIHPDKLKLIITQKMTLLGFVRDSRMTQKLNKRKYLLFLKKL